MLTVFVCALLLCNFVLVALIVSGKPSDKTASTQSPDLPPPDPIPKESKGFEDADILKIVKIAAQEIVAEIRHEWGKIEDADPADIIELVSTKAEQKSSTDANPSVLSPAEIKGIFDEEDQMVSEPQAGGLDFENFEKTVRMTKGAPVLEKDIPAIQQTLKEMRGMEYFDQITLDPIVRKRILQIECQLPTVEYGPEDFPDEKDNAEAVKPRRKSLFHTKVDVRDIDEIDFNVIR